MVLFFLFAVTNFLSAWLLFTVQPMFGKMVLPLLGGAPAVWNACMFFFQTALLAGYAYVHLSVSRLGLRRQAILQVAILALPALVLPVVIPRAWVPPSESNPLPSLLLLLTFSVGLPFFAVSTTSPLLQKWFARTRHGSAGDPYFLYSASNLGSMVAMLSYPVLVEPFLGLGMQSRAWTFGYAGYFLLVCVCAVVAWRSWGTHEANRGAEETGPEDTPSDIEGRARPVDIRRRLWWAVLSFIPSSWMLGVTTHLTTDITPMPLLWVIPLGIYLLSFILVFARRPLISQSWMARAFPVAILAMVVAVIFVGAWQALPLHLMAFSVGAMVFHGQLAADRPPTRHLTDYYLWIAVGGMAGGLFNALIAPLAFPAVLEYPLTVTVACLLLPGRSRDGQGRRSRWPAVVLLAGVVVLVALLLFFLEPGRGKLLFACAIGLVPLLVGFLLARKRPWLAFAVGTVFLLDAFQDAVASNIVYSARGFFGVHRVVLSRDQQSRHLMHGTTSHGAQSLDPLGQCVPMAYYHPDGPMGHAFPTLLQGNGPHRIAVVGLGAGASVCYRGKDDQFVFFEIDPLVKQIAENPDLFSYLSRCAEGGYEVVLGDGRLGLGKAPDKSFHLILLDAFSSDAIPAHLLTREAVRLYRSKLVDGGSLVFHITNRHLDLEPALSTLAYDARLFCVSGRDLDVTEEERSRGHSRSHYVVLTESEDRVRDLIAHPLWETVTTVGMLTPWTDDFSSIFSVLKWK